MRGEAVSLSVGERLGVGGALGVVGGFFGIGGDLSGWWAWVERVYYSSNVTVEQG